MAFFCCLLKACRVLTVRVALGLLLAALLGGGTGTAYAENMPATIATALTDSFSNALSANRSHLDRFYANTPSSNTPSASVPPASASSTHTPSASVPPASASSTLSSLPAPELGAGLKIAAPPPPSTPPTGEHEVWNSLFQSRLQALRTILEQIDAQTRNLPSLLDALKKEASIISGEYQQLLTLAQISRNLPMELGVVLDQMQRLLERLHKATAPLNSLHKQAVNNLEEMSQLEIRLEALDLATSHSTLAEEYIAQIGAAQHRLSLLKNRLNYALAPVSSLATDISTEQSALASSLPQLWRLYYLSPSQRLFNPDDWTDASNAVHVFRQTFSLRMHAQLPQSKGEILHVAGRAFVTLLFLAGLCLFTRRFVRSQPEEIRIGLHRLTRHSLPLLSCGLALYVAAWVPQDNPYHVLVVAATFLLSLGQLAFAWDIRCFGRSDLPRNSPFGALFAPLLGGLALLFFNLPPEPLGLLWAMVLGLCLWQEHRKMPRNLPFQLELNVLLTHRVFLWMLLAVTLFGWGRLSILLCMAFAGLATCLQQAVAFVGLSTRLTDAMSQSGFRGLLMSVCIALVAPVVLVLFTISMGLWILAYPGGSYLLEQAAHLDIRLGEHSLSIVQMLFLLSAFYITRSAISVGRLFLRRLPQQGVSLDPALVSPLQTAYAYVLWGLFILYALSSLGFSLTSLAVVAGGLSVGVGFGLQSIISNFISGLLLIFGQNLREGDIIEIGGVTGTVKRIDIRSTMVETFDCSIIFVPNASLLSNNLINWTRNGRMVRKSLNIGVAYGSDVALTMRVLRETADAHPSVLSYPEPMILFESFGSSTLNFCLRVWMPDINMALVVVSDLHVRINEAFAEHNIVLAFPQLDVHFDDTAASPPPKTERLSPPQGT